MFSLQVFRLDRTTAAFLAATFAKCTVAGGDERRPKIVSESEVKTLIVLLENSH
jgi:hypothetical protein